MAQGFLIDVPTEPARTLEQSQAIAIRQLYIRKERVLVQMEGLFNFGMDLVWNNKDGLTPQQVCDGFGVQAAMLFELAEGMKNLVNLAEPGRITRGAPNQIGFDVDANQQPTGTVKIGDPIPVPPPPTPPSPDEQTQPPGAS